MVEGTWEFNADLASHEQRVEGLKSNVKVGIASLTPDLTPDPIPCVPAAGEPLPEEESKTNSGLPLFASIPFIGKVFGNNNSSAARQELLVFIQPEIIDDTADLQRPDRDYDRRMPC